MEEPAQIEELPVRQGFEQSEQWTRCFGRLQYGAYPTHCLLHFIQSLPLSSGTAPQIHMRGRLVLIGSPSRNLMALSNSVLDIWHPFELEGTGRKAETAELEDDEILIYVWGLTE